MKTEVFFNKTFSAWFFVLIAVLLVVPGCSDGRPQRVPVSGTVTIDGKPVPYGSIRVWPAGQRMATGKIDKEGHFTLSCYGGNDGIMPGTHTVSVTAIENVNARTVRWHAPKKYMDPKTSDLKVKIDGPTDNLEVKLTWGGQKGPFTEATTAAE